MSNLFQKSELIYLFLSIIGVTVLTSLILVPSFNTFISSLNPILQFLILNLGLYLIFILFIKGISLKKKRIWEGALGTIVSFMAVDLILPEYHALPSGLIPGGLFGTSSVDYFFGYLYSLLGASGNLLVILVYPITFLALIFLGSLLVKDFVKRL